MPTPRPLKNKAKITRCQPPPPTFQAQCASEDADVRAAFREAMARGNEGEGDSGDSAADVQPRMPMLTICEL